MDSNRKKRIQLALRTVFYSTLAVYFYILISANIGGESVSLTELRYEMMSDDNYAAVTQEDNYDNGNNNYSVGTDGYYNITDTGCLLVDTHIFNFTDMREFYIEYFTLAEVNLTIEFRFSYLYGDVSGYSYKAVQKDLYLGYQDIYQNAPLASDFTNSHIQLYYNRNNSYIRGDRFFDSLKPSTRIQYDKDLHNPDVVEYEIYPDFTDTEFQRETILIENNFEYIDTPELRYFCQIWLKNISSYCYVRDYGFNYDSGKILEQEVYGNYTYYPSYGDDSYIFDINISSTGTGWYPSAWIENIVVSSLYDDTYQHFIRQVFQSQTYLAIYSYHSVKQFNYETNLILPFELLASHSYGGLPGGWNQQYAYTGYAIICNKYSMVTYAKNYFNLDYILYGKVYSFEQEIIAYENPKRYYGHAVNNTLLGDVYIEDISMETFDIKTERNTIDLTEVSFPEPLHQIVTKSEKSVLVKIYDRLAAGFSYVVDGITYWLEPVFDTVYSALEPLIDIIMEIEAVQVLIGTIDGIIDSIWTFLSNDLPDFFIDVGDFFIDILADIATMLTDLAAVVGLLTIADIFYQLIILVVDVAVLMFTYVQQFIVFLIDWITVFYGFLALFFETVLSVLLLYLLGIIALTMARIAFAIDDSVDVGIIMKDFVEMMLYPIKLLVEMIWKVLNFVWGILPI